MPSPTTITVTPLPSRNPSPPPPGTPPPHHIPHGPQKRFTNPWPSYKPTVSALTMLNARFFRADRKFVPVPADRAELVSWRVPDWGWDGERERERLKATWIGHASWFVEVATATSKEEEGSESGSRSRRRGVGVLFDPVFSERTSPVKFIGPKRYTPTPCNIAELPPVDVVVISHNHYDHLDIDSITELWRRSRDVHFFCGLGNKAWFESLDCGIPEGNIHDMDWWDGATVEVDGVGRVRVTCTPAQHSSSRSINDKDATLWCSWVVEEVDSPEDNRKLYFAGDTGYRHVDKPNPSPEEEAAAPVCPAFKQIGEVFGSFDLALLPIGLFLPRDTASSVHAAPEDSICIHKDIRSKKSIGMHYGTVRGGISGQYEDVREPPRRWKEMCEKAGLKWGEEVGLCGVGDTVAV